MSTPVGGGPRILKQRAASLREEGKSWVDIAELLRDEFNLNARVAIRLAHGWSQEDVANRWNERWPDALKRNKDISYWENWPNSTGREPSLDNLTKLARIYECSVSDLVADLANYRSEDGYSVESRGRSPVLNADVVRQAVASQARDVAVPDTLTELARRLVDTDMDEIYRLVQLWVHRIDDRIDQRILLTRLTAAFARAAESSVSGSEAEGAVSESTGIGKVAGIWHSQYLFYSSTREGEFGSEHYVVLRQKGNRISGQSLPHSMDSRLKFDLTLKGLAVTGTWSERTSPRGYYKGAIYHGAIQLLLDPTNRVLTGKWVGFGRDFKVNLGDWELTRVSDSTSQREQLLYHLKA